MRERMKKKKAMQLAAGWHILECNRQRTKARPKAKSHTNMDQGRF